MTFETFSTLSQTSPGFYGSYENTVGKVETAGNKQFLLFLQHFLHILRISFHFYQIRNCRMQTLSVWKTLKLNIWKRVKQKYAKNIISFLQSQVYVDKDILNYCPSLTYFF